MSYTYTLILALGPELKLFIGGVAFAGVVAIAGLVFLLKEIEKKDPS